MKSNTNHDDQEARARFALRETFVSEPDLDDCRPREKWRLKFLKLQLTGKHEIEIEFRTRDDQWQMLRVENWRRSDFNSIRRELDAHNACLPSNRKDANAFVEELIRQTPTVPFIACASPQFCNRATGFVMPYRQYGTAYGAYLWDDVNAPPEFGKIKGDLATYQRTVLRIARSSPYVSLAIMIALAGTLVDYVERRRGVRLLTETAIVHFVGESSSGKTTVGRVGQSVGGSPTIETDYEATDRGIAEHAYRRNNLVLVIDDTESAGLTNSEILAKMLKFAHHVPRGRYRAISMKASRSDLPELRWSEYAISSGPSRSRRWRRGCSASGAATASASWTSHCRRWPRAASLAAPSPLTENRRAIRRDSSTSSRTVSWHVSVCSSTHGSSTCSLTISRIA